MKITPYPVSFRKAKGIQFNGRSLKIINPDIAKDLKGLKQIRTPFDNKKLTEIFEKLNSRKYRYIYLGTYNEDLVRSQTLDTEPGVYALITDMKGFKSLISETSGTMQRAVHIKRRDEGIIDENTIVVAIYRVVEEKGTSKETLTKTWLRRLFGLNL